MSRRFGGIFAVTLTLMEMDGNRAFFRKTVTLKSLHVANTRPEDGVKKFIRNVETFNPLTPNDPYRGRTAPLTSKRCILYIYSTNTGTGLF